MRLSSSTHGSTHLSLSLFSPAARFSFPQVFSTMYHAPPKIPSRENKKPAKSTNPVGKGLAMAGSRAVDANGRNRRALGDISNLVSSLPNQATIGNALNPGNSEAENHGSQLNRPVTRRYGATLAYKKQIAKPVTVPLLATESSTKNSEIENTWGTKARQTLKPGANSHSEAHILDKSQLSVTFVDQDDACSDGRNAAFSAVFRSEEIHGGKRTLTASLTARSEAAAGAFLDNIGVNIDADDVGNELAVVEYIEDIYSFYRNVEVFSCVASNYMSTQTDINEGMRAILIDWLIEVHYKFKLMPETLFLTINVIDRFLATQKVSRNKLQLVGVSAMLIAAKYEEVSFPVIEDLVFISDNAFAREDVLEMEIKMLNMLKFNLTVPTPYVFIMRFLKAASGDDKLMHLTFFLAELCLTEYITLKFKPSLIAASAVYTAKCTLQKFPLWNRRLQFHTGYTEDQLKVVASLMVTFHRKAKAGSSGAVFEKYSSLSFNAVASIRPASLAILKSC